MLKLRHVAVWSVLQEAHVALAASWRAGGATLPTPWHRLIRLLYTRLRQLTDSRCVASHPRAVPVGERARGPARIKGLRGIAYKQLVLTTRDAIHLLRIPVVCPAASCQPHVCRARRLERVDAQCVPVALPALVIGCVVARSISHPGGAGDTSTFHHVLVLCAELVGRSIEHDLCPPCLQGKADSAPRGTHHVPTVGQLVIPLNRNIIELPRGTDTDATNVFGQAFHADEAQTRVLPRSIAKPRQCWLPDSRRGCVPSVAAAASSPTRLGIPVKGVGKAVDGAALEAIPPVNLNFGIHITLAMLARARVGIKLDLFEVKVKSRSNTVPHAPDPRQWWRRRRRRRLRRVGCRLPRSAIIAELDEAYLWDWARAVKLV